jgi:Flp pilus assembly protein TadD
MDAESIRNFERAVGLIKNEDYEQAIELLKKIVEQSPGATAPYINLAIAYKHTDQVEQAEEHLKTALELIPGHPVASNEYGLLLRKAGRFAEARAVYEKTLSLFPDYQPVRRNLGILCDLYLNDPGCALEQYEIYSKAMPEDEQVKLWIADLRMQLKH